MFFRKVTNKSGNTSIQVVKKIGRKNKIVRHLGTARTPKELINLTQMAQNYLDQARVKSGVISLFDTRFERPELSKLLEKVEFTRVLDTAIYRYLSYFYHELGFDSLRDICFKDVVIARVVSPASKRQTKDILRVRFGKNYSLPKIYRSLKLIFVKNYQKRIETAIYNWIRKNDGKLTVVFFDVTTLYYEAFDEDDFRKFGFSKDNKANQPQIVVGLLVGRAGLPLSLHAFEGNTFEGKTMLPSLEDSFAHFNPRDLVIVADSAMFSEENLSLIESKKLKFIVGARLRNMTKDVFTKVVSLKKQDGATERIPLSKGRVLIISYSSKRAAKDKRDREKQIQKVKTILNSGLKKPVRRYKFLTLKKTEYQLNDELVEKEIKLEGIKGYLTNALNLSNGEVIKRYSELWQVEKDFRMSKSDLLVRPIFHTLKESIEAHLTIVFTALAVARQIELVTGKSLRTVISTLNQVKEVVVKDPVSGEVVSKFTNLTDEARSLLNHIGLWVT